MTGANLRIPEGKAPQAARDIAPLRMLRASAPRAVPRALRTPAPPCVPASQFERACAAKLAGLRHMNDLDPDIERYADGKGFRCIDATGRSVTDKQVLQRIRRLPRQRPGCLAKRLGNTLAICRESCVHPIVMNCFLAGTLTCAGPDAPCPRAGSADCSRTGTPRGPRLRMLADVCRPGASGCNEKISRS